MSSAPRQASKRRRVSASSSDSGLDDCASTNSSTSPGTGLDLGNKYPRLELNEEERKLCKKEGIILPSHYPLTKEEERNLKRIRRKIRNKLSAQDSRKRKKEYVDSMEARAMRCAAENAELQKKISMLENQNRTLVGQLKRLHQIIVNKGGISSSSPVAQVAMGGSKGQQTSTALMVLLLSSALFLIPGMRDQYEAKLNSGRGGDPGEIVSQAIKGPPLPGQSRSLLQFTQSIREEFPPTSAGAADVDNICSAPVGSKHHHVGLGSLKAPKIEAVGDSNNNVKNGALGDHDYYTTSGSQHVLMLRRVKAEPTDDRGGGGGEDLGLLKQARPQQRSYIEADVPAQGYGEAKMEQQMMEVNNEVVVVSSTASKLKLEDFYGAGMEEYEGNSFAESVRRLNVSVTGGNNATRTVVLHVPKGIR